jgi:hypothetical protein
LAEVDLVGTSHVDVAGVADVRIEKCYSLASHQQR